MKKILGLDLGTTSIGWAMVNEAENPSEQSSIIRLGVRVNPLTTGKDGELTQFTSGKAVSTNVGRRMKRSMRRNLQRYKLRREALKEILLKNGFITKETILSEQGNFSTFETWRLRAKAADEPVSLEDLARILLMLNKKRGYKSNHKLNASDGEAIDSMSIAMELYEKQLTPGEYVYSMLNKGIRHIPDFYSSDLNKEFDTIWNKQAEFYPDILTPLLYNSLQGKDKRQTWAICKEPFGIVGIKSQFKGLEQKIESYRYRSEAVSKKIDLEHLANVFQDINGNISSSSGYLGKISDRSKELYFDKITVGQYKYDQLQKDPNYSLKNQVFYRQDYLDEFERIWTVQAGSHPELTDDLKKDIRSVIIFYQRPLKSQKGLISLCEFEKRDIKVTVDGKEKTITIGMKVCPKSSPVFQEFKIRQTINDLLIDGEKLTPEQRETLFDELSLKEKMNKQEILSLLLKDPKNHQINFEQISGNETLARFLSIFAKYYEQEVGESFNSKWKSQTIKDKLSELFKAKGISLEILENDPCADNFDRQPSYMLWHLLYSFEGDNSRSGKDKLKAKLSTLYGFPEDLASSISTICFKDDYGSLSTKAIRKILPYMRDGLEYSEACEKAGYKHSKRSLTREEIEKKTYKSHIDPIRKNSLRNPVVEKILNQMVNVVNSLIDEYGKPDEIRIELARELKKSQKERAEMTRSISDAEKENYEIRKILTEQFGKAHPSQNDIVRYRLYAELKSNGFKTLYTDTYIPQEKLFSKEFDIEHIIPQAKRFDDSFGNKTLELRSANIEKGNDTAIDYVFKKYGKAGEDSFTAKIDNLYKAGDISKTKRNNLLTKDSEIPEGFIERDLRNSQYIARQAQEMLEEIVPRVVPTTGSVTARLREDWQLVDVMKELDWNKFEQLGMTSYHEDNDGRQIGKIEGWSKRNDHRHHAMDALTIAFCRSAYIQYLNNLNARLDKSKNDYIELSDYELDDLSKEDKSRVVMAIEDKYLKRIDGKLKFISPILPVESFRTEAKKQLEAILVSQKAKNKVTTNNVNISKCKGGTNRKLQLTPRGQLHNETVYGKICQQTTVEEKVGKNFDVQMISSVIDPRFRKALMERLMSNDGDPKKAFTGKNALDKKPVYIDPDQTECVPSLVKVIHSEDVFTIRKPVAPDLAIDKIIDSHIKSILKTRLKEYGDDAGKAFSNLDENPIWLNREKGIAIKRVTISGVSNADALHNKKDKEGNIIYSNGQTVPTDFVSTSNNHHIAIFEDADGNYQEYVASLFEVTQRRVNGLPIIDKDLHRDLGWKFLFTMKQNEYFVFPNSATGFNPAEIDLTDPKNYSTISPNLYRVQKIASKYYVFRHHLESTLDMDINDITFKRIQSSNGIKGIIKVRVNHIGDIVSVGEY